jgi:phytoene/squalene synthetase
MTAELADTADPTTEVFHFLSRTTGLVGLLCLPFVLTAPPEERATAVGYVAITLALAGMLRGVRGGGMPPRLEGRSVGVSLPEKDR